nr:MAG TPA: hypothetical protein [Caudoviricetes sp.]
MGFPTRETHFSASMPGAGAAHLCRVQDSGFQQAGAVQTLFGSQFFHPCGNRDIHFDAAVVDFLRDKFRIDRHRAYQIAGGSVRVDFRIFRGRGHGLAVFFHAVDMQAQRVLCLGKRGFKIFSIADATGQVGKIDGISAAPCGFQYRRIGEFSHCCSLLLWRRGLFQPRLFFDAL